MSVALFTVPIVAVTACISITKNEKSYAIKKSTSDLLTANCDEFLFYDDLVHEQEQKKKRVCPRFYT